MLVYDIDGIYLKIFISVLISKQFCLTGHDPFFLTMTYFCTLRRSLIVISKNHLHPTLCTSCTVFATLSLSLSVSALCQHFGVSWLLSELPKVILCPFVREQIFGP